MRIIVIPKINAMMGQRYPMEVVMDAMKVICVHNVKGQGWLLAIPWTRLLWRVYD